MKLNKKIGLIINYLKSYSKITLSIRHSEPNQILDFQFQKMAHS